MRRRLERISAWRVALGCAGPLRRARGRGRGLARPPRAEGRREPHPNSCAVRPRAPPCAALGASGGRIRRRRERGRRARRAACAAFAKATPLDGAQGLTPFCAPRAAPRRPRQVAYWWVVHAGPLSCGPDRETVEKDLLLKHKR